MRKYREALAAYEDRKAKIKKDPELVETLPEVVVPEYPERVPLVLPPRKKKVVKFKQHLKADPRDLLWRDQRALTET